MAKKKTIKDVEAEEKVTEVEETEKECSCGCGCGEDCDCGCQESGECHCHDKEELKKAKKEEKKKAKEEKKANKKDGYFSSVGKELKKVVWPDAGEVAKYSLAVIIFCVILVLFFVGVDALASFIKGLF
jgi:preprotein translocase SecE subunit